MLRRSISIKSSTSSILRLLNMMASKPRDLQSSLSQCSGMCLCQSTDDCIKSPFKRKVSSCSTSNVQGKATGESVERSIERGGLQWDKLSDDEKNIYFAHKSACVVSLENPTPSNRLHRMHNISLNITILWVCQL